MKLSSNQNGSSLLEVLIALFVLAIGMLGVLAMQTNAVKTSRSASLYSQSQLLAFGIYESMRATPEGELASYQLSSGDFKTRPDCVNSGDACSPQEIIDWNLFEWQTNIANSLPNGKGAISNVGDVYTISVEFLVGYQEDALGNASAETHTHELVAVF